MDEQAAFIDDDHQRQPEHQQRPGGDDRQVEHHADRHEEQAEQDRAERLDVAFQLVPVRRFGQHDAGDERAERDRQAQRVHHRGAGDDREQPGDDEQFALAKRPISRNKGLRTKRPASTSPTIAPTV